MVMVMATVKRIQTEVNNLNSEKFSVLMSVYKNDKYEYLKKAFNSIYTNSIIPNECVIIYDGEVSEDINNFLELEKKKLQAYSEIKILKLPYNLGLGLALREGLKHCTNSLIARVDSDDINRRDRFEKQIAYFKKNEKLILLGGQIKEFSDNDQTIASIRSVPVSMDEIKRFSQYRSPFNHPTVMFKKIYIEKIGSYQDIRGFEDYHLWARLIMSEAEYANVPDILVDMRAGLYNRRGGFKYLKNYAKLRKYFVKIGFTSKINEITCIYLMACSVSLPTQFRKWLYIKLLRK